MFLGQKIKLFISVLLISSFSSTIAFADNLVYQNRQNANPRAASSQSRLTQLQHSTTYDTQFAPLSSFMESPYEESFLQSPYAGTTPGGAPVADPYMASEVSPYAKYSPYIEVIGEGSDYTLGIDDVVTIIVRNQPDFSGRFIVNPEGNLQYNFVGDVKAEGRTKDELKVEIAEKLKEFVRYPEVAVMISEYRSKAVYVFGFVGRPGKYAMKGDKITVKEAVVAAGLPRQDGALKRVYVIRPSEYTETGKARKKKVNLKKLLYKGDSAEDFVLEPGDTIVVNQKNFDRFINTFSKVVGPLFQAAAVYELGFGNQDGFFNKD